MTNKPKKPAFCAYRFTGNEPEKAFFDALGVEPDNNSQPHLFEWYWTMSVEDANAVRSLMNKWPEHLFLQLKWSLIDTSTPEMWEKQCIEKGWIEKGRS